MPYPDDVLSVLSQKIHARYLQAEEAALIQADPDPRHVETQAERDAEHAAHVAQCLARAMIYLDNLEAALIDADVLL